MDSVGWTVSWLAGCALGLLVVDSYPMGLEPGYGWLMLGLALLAAIPLILAHSNRRATVAAWLLMALLAGCGRTMLVHPPITPHDLAYYNADSSKVQVVGVVSAEPLYKDRSQRLRISGESIQAQANSPLKQVEGDMYVVTARYPEFSLGERLSLSGTLTTPPNFGDFDYRGYLARQGVFSYMTFPRVQSVGRESSGLVTQLLAGWRSAVRGVLQRSIAEPEASLAVGVVTGDRSSMTQQTQDAFQRSGTTHILAISGENIALLVGMIWLFMGGQRGRRRMPGWLVAIVLALLVFYTAFTGATPSVVRAAIMGAILLCAPLVGRRYDPMAALALPALLMTLLDPNLLADPGFELTFAAMLGIGLVSPHLQNLLGRLRVPAILAVPVAASLGAQALTLPISAMISGQVSLVSPLATLTADIALLPLMITGIITSIAGVILAPLGALLGLVAWLCAAWMLFWVQLWAALPWASIDVGAINPAWVVVYYCALGGALWLAANRKHGRLVLNRSDVALAGAAACVWAVLLLVLLTR